MRDGLRWEVLVLRYGQGLLVLRAGACCGSSYMCGGGGGGGPLAWTSTWMVCVSWCVRVTCLLTVFVVAWGSFSVPAAAAAAGDIVEFGKCV
jgi:hypothetical protein